MLSFTLGTPDLNKVPADQVGERTEEQDEKRDKTKEEIAKEREKQAKSSAASEKKTFEVSMYKSGPKGPKVRTKHVYLNKVLFVAYFLQYVTCSFS